MNDSHILAGRTWLRTLGPSNRRHFLATLGLTAAAARLRSLAAPATGLHSEVNPANQALLAALGKDPRLIVHGSRPIVLETPLELLRLHSNTPRSMLFIRNNLSGDAGLTPAPQPINDWTIGLTGLINGDRVVKGAELANYPQTEVEMVLQCSGNGRSFYAQAVRTRGTQWGRGGVGNVRWKGVPVASLLQSLQVEVQPEARFVAAEGGDAPESGEGADFEHSLPLRDVLDKAILALEMNGEPIPAIHGGPVRLIVPGFYGTMNIKWLTRLRFEKAESTNHNHIPRYRTFREPIQPGTSPEFTFENSVPCWHQRMNSFIWKPAESEIVRPGRLEVSGVAWNDGLAAIEGVEISQNRGQSWRKGELEKPASPYAWYLWKSEVAVSPENPEIWVRAFDALGRSQPLDGTILWNPSGYEWHGVDRLKVAFA